MEMDQKNVVNELLNRKLGIWHLVKKEDWREA